MILVAKEPTLMGSSNLLAAQQFPNLGFVGRPQIERLLDSEIEVERVVALGREEAGAQ